MSKIIEVVVKYDDGHEKVVSGDAVLAWAEWLDYQVNGVEFPDAPDTAKYTDPEKFLSDVQAYTEELSKFSR
jgi:hypothetical protein